MSALLDEIIAALKARAIEYEEYLKRIAELAKRVEAGQTEDTPEQLNTPGRRALYNNLRKATMSDEVTGVSTPPGPHWNATKDEVLELAVRIDETVKLVRPDGWRGVKPKENLIKGALLPLLGNDMAEVERIFLIIEKHKSEY
jgi:type I restriction enzyme R subunit